MRISPLILVVACVNLAHAQQPPADRIPAALTGSVAGHISYANSQLPARFAEVILVHKPTDAELQPSVEDKSSRVARPGARRPETESTQVVSVSGRSGMDGSFRIDGIPAGDYLLVARIPGYLTPGAQAQSAPVRQQIASLPAVHVAIGQVASANLTLSRGGVLGGRVQFADGSPVIGAPVTFQAADSRLAQTEEELSYLPLQNAEQENIGSFRVFQGNRTTDDEGHFRISGLLPGKYLVVTMITTDQGAAQVLVGNQYSLRGTGNGGMPQPMTVYEPGVFRRKDAKVFEIHADEQLLDADIKVDPSGLHTVRGRLVAGDDRHAPKQATVQLRESGSTDLRDMGDLAQSAPDGSFQIANVPAGTYTLAVVFATDQDLSKMMDEARRDGVGAVSSVRALTQVYKSQKVPVLVGEHDVTLDDVVLTNAKPIKEEDTDPPR